MTTDVTTALRLLREADPARTALVAPPPVLPAGLAAAPDRKPSIERRRRLAALLVAAAVVLLLVGIAWLAGLPRAVTAPTALPTQTPQAGPTAVPSPDPHLAATVRIVEQLLASVPALPGATATSNAPTSSLADPAQIEAGDNVVIRSAFWTAPLPQADALAFYRTHPPDGTTQNGSDSGPDDRQGLMFSAAGTTESTAPTVEVTVVPFGAGVAVRADAMAIWIPTKPASEYLGPVISVDVTVDRASAAPPVTRTLTGTAAQRLAAALDALVPEPPYGPRPCPFDPGFVDTLVFHAPGRTITAVATVYGCAGVAMDVNGAAQPRLAGSIDQQVLAELGLPPTYGH
ncbi:MAG TPA: hypothetical protein VH561_16355 [Micromonosporaceae bacterium]